MQVFTGLQAFSMPIFDGNYTAGQHLQALLTMQGKHPQN